jgi:hypothetical protein
MDPLPHEVKRRRLPAYMYSKEPAKESKNEDVRDAKEALHSP